MAAGVEDAAHPHGAGGLGVVVGVAHHQAAGRVGPAGGDVVPPQLHLAGAVDVRQAQHGLEGVPQPPAGGLLGQIVPAGDGQQGLPDAPACQRPDDAGGALGQGTGVHPGVVALHIALGQKGEGVAPKVEPHPAVIVLDGEAEHRPVGVQVIPLGIAVFVQQPVQAAAGIGGVVHQGAVPVPENKRRCSHDSLLDRVRRCGRLRR